MNEKLEIHHSCALIRDQMIFELGCDAIRTRLKCLGIWSSKLENEILSSTSSADLMTISSTISHSRSSLPAARLKQNPMIIISAN